MSVEYSAIAAKLKAMYSRFLSAKDYEEILNRKSVNDICAYLKSTQGYSDVLGEVNEKQIHRGEMELLLEQDIMDEYVRLYSFVDHTKRSMLEFWFMRREIEFLKRETRHIYTHEECSSDEVNQGIFEAFFETHTKINRDIMRNAKSLSDCIEACKDTPYREPLQRAENLGSDFFSTGMILDSYYFTTFWHSICRKLKGVQAELFKKMIGTQIDMLNLMWIYRGKKYFDFKNEIIFTYLLPIRYRLTEDLMKQLVSTESVEKFVEMVRNTTCYDELFYEYDNGIFPEENYRNMYNKLSKNIFVNHSESMVAIYAYLNLKEVELNNITIITEGIRYNLNPDSIRGHIGIE